MLTNNLSFYFLANRDFRSFTKLTLSDSIHVFLGFPDTDLSFINGLPKLADAFCPPAIPIFKPREAGAIAPLQSKRLNVHSEAPVKQRNSISTPDEVLEDVLKQWFKGNVWYKIIPSSGSLDTEHDTSTWIILYNNHNRNSKTETKLYI